MPARFSLRRRSSTPPPAEVEEPTLVDTEQLPHTSRAAGSAWQRPPAGAAEAGTGGEVRGPGGATRGPAAVPEPGVNESSGDAEERPDEAGTYEVGADKTRTYDEGTYEDAPYEDGAYEEGPGYLGDAYYPAVYGSAIPAALTGDGAPSEEDDESWLAPDTRRRVKMAVPTFLLAVLVVVAGAFWGGAEVDKHYGNHNTASASAASVANALRSAGFGSLRRGTGATGFAGTGGGGFGGLGGLTPVAQGTVSAVSGRELTVTPTGGGTKVTVVLNTSTVVTRSGKGAAGSLGVGDRVTVLGSKAANGTVTATSVIASAPGVSAGGFAGLGGSSGAAGTGGSGGRSTGGSGSSGSGTGSGSGLVKNGGFAGDGSGVSGG